MLIKFIEILVSQGGSQGTARAKVLSQVTWRTLVRRHHLIDDYNLLMFCNDTFHTGITNVCIMKETVNLYKKLYMETEEQKKEIYVSNDKTSACTYNNTEIQT